LSLKRIKPSGHIGNIEDGVDGPTQVGFTEAMMGFQDPAGLDPSNALSSFFTYPPFFLRTLQIFGPEKGKFISQPGVFVVSACHRVFELFSLVSRLASWVSPLSQKSLPEIQPI
jgi:hypothetical protein